MKSVLYLEFSTFVSEWLRNNALDTATHRSSGGSMTCTFTQNLFCLQTVYLGLVVRGQDLGSGVGSGRVVIIPFKKERSTIAYGSNIM